jgi:hypothetical protein
MNDHALLANCGRILAWATISLLCPAVALAEMGIKDTFPGPRTKMRNNLTVEVDSRGVVANGYRSVRVKLSNTPSRNKPPVPVTADRRFRVVIEPSGAGHLSAVATQQVIEIPENQASAEATIAIPSAGDWYQLQVNVYEGGDKLEDVSELLHFGAWGMRTDSESNPTLLFIDYDVPDRATRDALIASPPTNDTYTLPNFSQVVLNIGYQNTMMAASVAPLASGGELSDAQILTQALQYPKVQLLPPDEMPRRWIELSCYDIAFISVGDLAKMAKENPAQKRALVDWLHGGPALVVYGAGGNFSQLAQIEQLLDLRPLPDAQRTPTIGGWATNQAFGALPSLRRPAGLGLVVAVASVTPRNVASTSPTITIDDPFAPGSSGDWNKVLQQIDLRHQNWTTRHGMSYQSYNQGLWNWYIPGVGAAPVFSFLLLATLFAIVIGPVNYLLLGRIQRLYLLLVTVPVGAAIVTLCLFAYAVLSDGLGVKARVRSFSLLDQKTGRTVSWSRQSYYASLVPSGGLKFPADATVWPLEEEPQLNRQRGPWHQFAWEEDGQRLRSGYLSSRRLTQFMVVRSAKTPSKLTVVQASSTAAPQVTNSLGGEIRQLILRDPQGTYFVAERPLKAGQSAALKLTTPSEAKYTIGQIVTDPPKDFPAGYDPAEEARRAYSPWSRGPWMGYSANQPSLETSILEWNISALQSPPGDALEPGSYLAVLDSNSDVPLGIAAAHEAKSLHVVLGRFPSTVKSP